jgi:hypothetical protein
VARSLLIILALAVASAVPAFASDIGAVKCGSNQDRVWVYESLNSFDVETRLKCGETVEILARLRGYVKIRTASGVEGYVPDAAFPDLPALPPDDADRPVASLAARATTSTATHAVAMPLPAVAPQAVAADAAPASAKTAAPVSAPVASAPPTMTAKPAPVAESKSAITAGPANSAVALSSAAHPAADVKTASAVSAPAHAKPHERAATPAVVAEPAPPKKTPAKPAQANTQSAKSTIGVAQPAVSVAMVVPAKATPASAVMMDTSANASPKADITIHEPARDPDLEEYPDAKPENESADPACHVFFSAYGLAPAQYKWMVENRRKQYASICPAPDLAHVDFVILFAHDSDTYNSAMPAPVHTDRSGFSDFSPLTTVDTALQSLSDLDKARYEFVWVFHAKRGTFDPTKFSVRRRPLFTTDAKGSHAAGRAVEDAFQFIEGQGSPDR